MRTNIGLFVIALVVVVVLPVCTDATIKGANESPLNDIIMSHFKTLQKDPLVRRILKERVEEEEIPEKQPKKFVSHKCTHDEHREATGHSVKYNEEARAKLARFYEEHLIDSNKKRSVSQITGPLRIYADTSLLSTTDANSCLSTGSVVKLDTGASYTCLAVDVLTTAKVSILKNTIIPAVVDSIRELISVKGRTPSGTNFRLDSDYNTHYPSCRSNVGFPSNAFSPGVAGYDYYMMFAARPIASNQTLANALPCNYHILQNGYFSRPLGGSVNFNPGSSDLNRFIQNPTDSWLFQEIVTVGLHEVVHALGFTADLYSDYQTPTGNLYKNGATTTGNYQGMTRTLISTPAVIAFAQKHYNCPSLTGVELQSYGGSGSTGSHWASRIMPNEFMTAIAFSEKQLVTGLTLSLLEDTGWYESNYALASPVRWGKNLGCNFLSQKCSPSNWGRLFCSDTAVHACTGERDAVGYCPLSRYSPSLPPAYQYFSEPNIGGGAWYDYCPIVTGYDNLYCSDARGWEGQPQTGYSPSTKALCYDIQLSGFNANPNEQGSCYTTYCTVNPATNQTSAILTISGANYSCTSGSQIQVNSLGLTVTCPDMNFVCPPGVSKVDYSWNPSADQPFGSAPFLGPRTFTIPDLPTFTGSGNSTLGFFQPLLDQWSLTPGSTLFYILIAVAACVVISIVCGCLKACCK